MAPKRKIIIDCDPGVDDVIGLLLAFNAPDIEIALVSLCFGNVDTAASLRNVIATLSVLGRESEFRKERGLPALQFDPADRAAWPTVACGSDEPMSEVRHTADYYHGVDGLGGVHAALPELSTPADYRLPFVPDAQLTPAEVEAKRAATAAVVGYVPSDREPADLVLEILAAEPAGTVTIVALAPMTNLAHAALRNPAVFSRAAAVNAMGGAIAVAGNMSPLAEFNVFADPEASAVVYAMTSPSPLSTMPPAIARTLSDETRAALAAVPAPIELNLFPLDITFQYSLKRTEFMAAAAPLAAAGSPLARWMSYWMEVTFDKMRVLIGVKGADDPNADLLIRLHDPLTVWYTVLGQPDASPSVLTHYPSGAPILPSEFQFARASDVRIETTGQWTTGACIVEHRPGATKRVYTSPAESAQDYGRWLDAEAGNRVNVAAPGPAPAAFVRALLATLFP
ncbi:Inosine/uridine-preferring nucleoside hydrolase domain-containing protein [Dipodascopsis tothii]|uniref:Inosine/uridine-preferring nucleoside hydrolase domain-containing protein n=1 Tax=Dipodascopsis tothii TaxID=44089 RepID=UPI0034CF128E